MATAKFSPWYPAERCTAGPGAGSRALMAHVLATFGKARNWGIYNCRTVRGGVTTSAHGEGRAIDVGFPLDGGRGSSYGYALVNAILAAGPWRLGVMAIIYDRRIWSAKSPGGRPYTGAAPHYDHVHVELTRSAAARLTRATVAAVLGGNASLPDTGGDDGARFPGASAFRVGHSHPAVTVLDRRLIAHGYARHHDGDGYQPGPVFTRYTRDNVAEFQRAQGWKGEDADGIPGPQTWARLMAAPKPKPKPKPPAKPKPSGPVVDLAKLRKAAKKDPPRASSKAAYPAGTRVVEAALVAEGLLAPKRADKVGHWGSDTVDAYAAWQRSEAGGGYRGADADGTPGGDSLRRLAARHGFRVG